MTCKDNCLSYNACSYHIDEETPFSVTECNNFKNKADFVEVEKVAKMLEEQCGDYPCNLNDNAEWLCLIDCDCKCSMKCWEKFVRHYGERKDTRTTKLEHNSLCETETYKVGD